MKENTRDTVSINPTWWWKRSFLERCLMIMTVCAILGIIALGIVICVLSSTAKNCHLRNDEETISAKIISYKESTGICVSEECIHAASNILKHMDPNIKPCDNFYKFACGNFLENTVIPDDKLRINPTEIIRDNIQQQLRKILQEEPKPTEPKYFRLIKTFYHNCMNETAINMKGVKPLAKILKKVGGWPVLEGDSWKEEDFDWKQLIHKLKNEKILIPSFFECSVTVDFNNSSRPLLYIDQPKFPFSIKNLTRGFKDNIVKAYHTYMVDIAIIFGANKTKAEKELKQTLEIEISLANISKTHEQRNISTFNNTLTIKELQGNFSSIQWKEYFNGILEPTNKIEEDDEILVYNLDYFKKLESVIEKISKRDQANYIMFKAIANTARFLSKNVRNKKLKFLMSTRDNVETNPRWEECVKMSKDQLHIIIDTLYIKKCITPDSKKNTHEMIKNICHRFQEIIKNVDWMDNKTKASNLEKLMHMKSYVAYDDESLNDNEYDEFYENLEVTSEDFYQSVLNVSHFNTNHSFSLLGEVVNESSWHSSISPFIVNAFYSPPQNSFYIPAGIIQGAFLINNRPRYLNYGAIGFVIGHEMTHGFDDNGIKFDKEGNLTDWWKPESKEKFLSKAECIIRQYGNYTDEEVGLSLNGSNTETENIADNGGVKVSYLAYQEWVKENGHEPMLPGLDYTPSQLFWISVAQAWCTKHSPDFLKALILFSNYSPAEFRILGSFSNRPEFAEDFQCLEGSRMNPVKKCSIW